MAYPGPSAARPIRGGESPNPGVYQMAEQRIPDPTLMARLQLSVKGVDWAASLVAHRQHEQVDGEWSAHQHVSHLIAVETGVFQPRVRRMIDEDRPVLEPWDEAGYMANAYRAEGDVVDLAGEFMRQREATVELFKSLAPEQWKRTGVWPAGEVDLAWAAEKCVAHALEHFVALLLIHQDTEHLQARRWFGEG